MDPKSRFARLVRFIMRDVTYHKLYPCEVKAQGDDYSLDLVPDDEKMRGNGLGAVRIRHGLPGAKVRLKAGARVLLGFEGGDPSIPYAALWEGDPDVVISIELPGDSRPVARMGDPILVFINPAVPIPMQGVINGVTPFFGTIQITTPVSGIIQSGNRKLIA